MNAVHNMSAHRLPHDWRKQFGREKVSTPRQHMRYECVVGDTITRTGDRLMKEPLNSTLTAVGGLRVGHWTDEAALTGCTVIVCDHGAVAGVDVRGGGPGTRETDLLAPGRLVERIDAVLLTGGSAFGLAAADGVMRYLEEQGRGFDTGVARVPIVPAAVIFDLGIGDGSVRPGSDQGYAAAASATGDPVSEGNVGAGTGATAGKWAEPTFAMKSGLGTSAIKLPGGGTVGAIVAANPVGDIVDPLTGSIVAGAYDRTVRSFVTQPAGDGSGDGGVGKDLGGTSSQGKGATGSDRLARSGAERPADRDADGGSASGADGGFSPSVDGGFARAARISAVRFSPSNTVIAVVATDVPLSKEAVHRVAMMAHDGIARTVYPAHTPFDGDTVFALSTGTAEIGPAEMERVALIGAVAAEALALAIVRAARAAASAGGLLACGDLVQR